MESPEKPKEENNNSNKEELKNEENELASETQNYTGFVTYETVFDFLIYNYYSIEMKEFNLTLEELRKLPLSSSKLELRRFHLQRLDADSLFIKMKNQM